MGFNITFFCVGHIAW